MSDGHDIVLSIDAVSHNFGPKKVLHQVELRIARGQIVALVGPSGCGKSTLLNMIAGTLMPAHGAVTLRRDGIEVPVRQVGADRGMVYQRYSLFPFLTAQENVALGPKLAETTIPGRMIGWITGSWRRQRARHMEEAAALLERVGLGDAIKRYPHELSGGMRQRVAIAQALIMRPEVLLLDEPFGALDEATREDLQKMLLGFYQENLSARAEGAPPEHTIFIVTHELNEAIYVSDRVVGLSQYWDWRKAGLNEGPGAMIIYDRQAPIYAPDDQKEYEQFVSQRDEIRKAVFSEEYLPSPTEFVDFWSEVHAGRGQGILKTEQSVTD